MWPITAETASARTLANAHRRRDALGTLWGSAPTQADIRGIRWAGWQAVTEYLDHHAPAASPIVRATRVLAGGAVAAREQRAFDLLPS